jgi:hypothetical protein
MARELLTRLLTVHLYLQLQEISATNSLLARTPIIIRLSQCSELKIEELDR